MGIINFKFIIMAFSKHLIHYLLTPSLTIIWPPLPNLNYFAGTRPTAVGIIGRPYS